MKKLFLILLLLIYTSIIANEQPKFAVIKSNKVNARSGPGTKYPINWTYIKKCEPVEIIASFDQWRKIRDYMGDGGWIHISMITSNKASVIIINEKINLYKDNDTKSPILAYLLKDVRCKVLKSKDKWCKLQCKDIIGWALKENLWGIE